MARGFIEVSVALLIQMLLLDSNGIREAYPTEYVKIMVEGDEIPEPEDGKMFQVIPTYKKRQHDYIEIMDISYRKEL